MRFLQLKETATGMVFDQPVLDMLLLSAVVHPNQQVAPAARLPRFQYRRHPVGRIFRKAAATTAHKKGTIADARLVSNFRLSR